MCALEAVTYIYTSFKYMTETNVKHMLTLGIFILYLNQTLVCLIVRVVNGLGGMLHFKVEKFISCEKEVHKTFIGILRWTVILPVVFI